MDDLTNLVSDDEVEDAAREALNLAIDVPIELNPKLRRMIRDALLAQRREPSPVFTRKRHMTWAGIGSSTKQLEIERNGEVDVLHDGAVVLVTVSSAYRRRIRQIIQSNPVHGPAPKARDRTPPLRGCVDKATGAI